MKFGEAMRELEEGKKVRPCIWPDSEHVISISDIVYELCEMEEYRLLELVTCDWQLYKEPVKTYTFQEIIPFLKEGKKVRRINHPENQYLQDQIGTVLVYSYGHAWLCKIEDFEATDWMVCDEN